MYRYMLIEPVETMLGRLKQPYSSNAPPPQAWIPKTQFFPGGRHGTSRIQTGSGANLRDSTGVSTFTLSEALTSKTQH